MTFKEFYRKENISPGKRTKMLQAKPEGGAGVVATESTNSSQLGRRTGYTVVFATNVMLSVAQMANGCGNFFAVGLPYGNGLQE